MSEYLMYVKIVGEPFLSRAEVYRSEFKECQRAWTAFMQEKGATAIPGGLSGLLFEHGNAPDGWKKPERKHGWSRPNKGHPDEAVLAALPKKPDSRAVFGDAIIENLNYEGPNGSWGGGGIGFFFEGPSIGWAGDTIFAVIPDAKKAADDHLAEHPDHKITSGADTWSLPSGLVQISEAEHNLIVAQYTVEWERAEKEKAA